MNTKEDVQHRLELVTKKHKHQHEIVHALEAEKAPEEFVIKLKAELSEIKSKMIFKKEPRHVW